MASNSVDFLSYKPDVTPASSTNHKADIINGYLKELKTAYIVMRRHPKVLKEFIEAVKGGANLPAEEPTATNPKPTSLIINGNL